MSLVQLFQQYFPSKKLYFKMEPALCHYRTELLEILI